jgi:hypothetical protein
MRMDPNKRCSHNRTLWWSFEDSQARHMSSTGNTQSSELCPEANDNPEAFRDERYIRD